MSALVFAGSLSVATQFPFYSLLEPLSAIIAVGTVVSWVKLRGLRDGLPEPFGKGKVSIIDAKSAARSGMLVTLGGVFLTIGVLGSVFIFPPEAFFAGVFGLTGGFPFAQILFFVLVYRLERAGKGRIFTVTEETEEDGRSVLRKSVELAFLH